MKINLLFSGGTDSTFSLFFLKKLKHSINCNFIKVCNENGNYLELVNSFNIAKKFKSNLEITNLIKKYKKKVFNIMISDYKRGLTPNPDIICNKRIKFGKEILKKNVKNFLCTGHYAIKKNFFTLPIDFKKDQTYFLSELKKNTIEKIFFPLGVFYRLEVEKIIDFLNLKKNINKKSKGICFLNIKKFPNFISKYVKKKCNIFYRGKVIAIKKILYKTIGQKIFINNFGNFYLGKKIKKNLFVVKGIKNPFLKKRIFYSKYFFLDIKKRYYFCLAKTFSSSLLFKCFILNKSILKIVFIKPVFSISKGQYIVFYKKKSKLLIGYAVVT